MRLAPACRARRARCRTPARRRVSRPETITTPRLRLFVAIVRPTLSWNDGLPLGRSGRVRLRRPGHVRREGRAPYPVARVRRGSRKRPLTSKNANSSWAPAGVPIGPARQNWIFAEANAASAARCDCVDVQRNGQRRPGDRDVQVPDGLVQAGMHALVVRVVRGIVGDDACRPRPTSAFPPLRRISRALTSPIFVPAPA